MPGRKKESETSPGRAAVNISEATNRLVNRGADAHRVSKAELLANLMRFFSDAPDSVQLIMMGTAPRDLKDLFASKASEYFASVADRSTREIEQEASADNLSDAQREAAAKVVGKEKKAGQKAPPENGRKAS